MQGLRKKIPPQFTNVNEEEFFECNAADACDISYFLPKRNCDDISR